MSRSDRDLKRVFVKTYGCQMNVYDSERMTDALAPAGYVAVDSAELAKWPTQCPLGSRWESKSRRAVS